MSHYDVKKIAERFKKPVEEVEKKIQDWKNSAKDVLKDEYQGGDLDDFIDSLVPTKLNDIFPMSGLEYIKSQIANGTITDISKINTIIVGVSPIRDDNDYNKRTITSAWWNGSEKERAELVKSGEVEVRTGKTGGQYPVAIDMRESFDNGTENPGYKKEFPFKPYRYIPMIVEGKLVMGKGDLANRDSPIKNYPRIGYKSIVYGRKVNKVFKITKDCYEDEGILENAWNFVEKPVKESEEFRTLDEIVNMDPYQKFVTIGNIWDINTKDPEKTSITIGIDGMDRGIKLSTRYAPLMQDIKKLVKGQDVIVYGEKKTFKNDEGNKIAYYELWGVIGKQDDARIAAIKKLQESNL